VSLVRGVAADALSLWDRQDSRDRRRRHESLDHLHAILPLGRVSRDARMLADLGAIDHPSGESRFAAGAPLDRCAGEWQAIRTEACRVNRVDRGQSERRIRCLDRRLSEFGDSPRRSKARRIPRRSIAR
jgi:hypothetical protein